MYQYIKRIHVDELVVQLKLLVLKLRVRSKEAHQQSFTEQ